MSKNKEPSATYKAIERNLDSKEAISILEGFPKHRSTVKQIPVGTVHSGTHAVVEIYTHENAFYVLAFAMVGKEIIPYTLDTNGPYKRYSKAFKRAMAVAERIVIAGYPHPKYWICH